jgi:uncharacterized protein DUF6599
MRRILPLFVLFSFLGAPVCLAQGMLPSTAANWKSKASATEIPAANVQQIAGAASAALQEYGIKSTETRTYERGASSFNATVFTFGSPSGAYGAYSFLRTPDMPQAKLTEHSCMSSERALALTGNLVVEFTGSDVRRAWDAMVLLVAQAGGHALFGIYPPLAQRLPTKDFVPRSDHYLLGPVALGQLLPLAQGDWVGFSKGAEAELARYKIAGHDSTLLIADYPTPQIAQTRLKELEAQLGAVDVASAKGQSASATAKNGTPLYAARDTTMVALVSGAPSEQAATSLLEQVHAHFDLTWNEPVLNKNQPSMATIVVGTIVGAGEICMFTLLGGVIFAGLRLLIKKMWPGRVFDRATSCEILELGLSDRPIRTNDLYQLRN